MCVAVGAVVAKVVKKVLAILAGDKNGRKFLGYVVGIALFIVLLPVIAVYGLFGWMAGGGAAEVSKAKTIFISCLTGKETEEDFYQRYADCFLLQSEEQSLWDLISSAFGVSFSDEEKQQFNNLYGG